MQVNDMQVEAMQESMFYETYHLIYGKSGCNRKDAPLFKGWELFCTVFERSPTKDAFI